MKRVLYLSADDPTVSIADDQSTEAPLLELGIQVDTRAWKQPTPWSDYDAVVVRSTWDYWEKPQDFLKLLSSIPVPLFNSAETVAWNFDKSYLSRFESLALPTHLHSAKEMSASLLQDYQKRYGTLVVKPPIGLGGIETFLVDSEFQDFQRFQNRERWMVQPLATSIHESGELSLMYFNREFSHAVLKLPKAEEFRIHEHFGGTNQLVTPEPEALQLASQVLDSVDDELLYARVDLVKYQQRWCLMELELIEPSLYFQFDPESPARFARALESRL